MISREKTQTTSRKEKTMAKAKTNGAHIDTEIRIDLPQYMDPDALISWCPGEDTYFQMPVLSWSDVEYTQEVTARNSHHSAIDCSEFYTGK